MAVWNRPVSWSRMRLALNCPKQLEFSIDGYPQSYRTPNYYAELGTVVQYVFERYYKDRIGEKGGTSPEIITKCGNVILNSSWFKRREITYPMGKSMEDFQKDVHSLLSTGMEAMRTAKILTEPLKSEVGIRGKFRDLPLFGKFDFVQETPNGVHIFDGKGNKAKNADPGQLKLYALILLSKGRRVAGASFIYWRYGEEGVENIDVTPEGLKEFIDGDFQNAREIFYKLRGGWSDLPATPSKTACQYCNYQKSCPHSFYKKEEDSQIEYVSGPISLGELRAR